MPRLSPQYAARLARLAQELARQQGLATGLKYRLEAAESAGLAVEGGLLLEGQTRLWATLQAQLDAVQATLQALATDPAQDPRPVLNDVEARLAASSWGAVEQVTVDLVQQQAALEAQIREYQTRFRQWLGDIETLRDQVNEASDAKAAVVSEAQEVAALTELVRGVERAFQDRGFDPNWLGYLLLTMPKLEANAQAPAGLRARIEQKVADARNFARQADLLLLCSTGSKKHYEYSVLLRTPQEPGLHGIDIQDSSILVRQDHVRFDELTKLLTQQINLDLRGIFAGKRAPAAPVTPAGNGAGAAAVPAAAGNGQEAANAGAAAAGVAAADAGAAVPPAPGGLPGPVIAVVPAAAPAPAAPVPPLAQAAPAAPVPVAAIAGQAAEPGPARQIVLTGAPAALPPPGTYRSASEVVRLLGDRMYSLVMPEEMRNYLQVTPCSLTIRTNDLELPWELMCWRDGSDYEYLCLNRPVARMPMGRAFPRRERRVDPGGRILRFLLIYADPYSNLPNAGSEINAIEKGLKSRWAERIEIVTLRGDQANGQRLNDELQAGAFDVIHYAGHAAFDRRNPDMSGLLLHRSEVFYAQKVRRLLEGQPLVFLNACESGRTANETEPQAVSRYLQRPAEGLAAAFIYGGAAGCIGALWPVYDGPAAELAIDFYNLVVDGYMVGEALRLARLNSHKAHPNQITWASFIHYGDPTYQLR